MQDLRMIGVHEDGQHLLLADADGKRFQVPLDEALRAAARRDRPRLGPAQTRADGGLRPRDVQSMIRGGASAEEVAERCGWSVEKVHKYEGPILAEREHVAQLAQAVRLRVRGGSGSGAAATLASRVRERMAKRGVDPAAAEWDAWRSESGPWTVVVTFAAGGRQRQASWSFDAGARTVSAADDEARWLSEDEPASGGPLPSAASAPVRSAAVYDVEAEGGVATAIRQSSGRQTEPVDLMTAMRERSSARARRGGARRRSGPADVPGAGQAPEDALPLEDLAFDPEVDGPPPGARVHPNDDPALRGAPDDEPGSASPGAAGAEPVLGDPGPREVAEPGQPGEPQPGAATEPGAAMGAAMGEPQAGAEPGEPQPGEPQPGERSRTTDKGRAHPRRSGRTPVPSWDDIMFGARSRD